MPTSLLDCFSSIEDPRPECFVAWVSHVTELTEGEVVAIDGKTLAPYEKFDTDMKIIMFQGL